MRGVLKVQVFSDGDDVSALCDEMGEAISCTKNSSLRSSEQLDRAAEASDVIVIEAHDDNEEVLLSAWTKQNPEFPIYVLTSEANADEIVESVTSVIISFFISTPVYV